VSQSGKELSPRLAAIIDALPVRPGGGDPRREIGLAD
jgi:hypothetical protein